MKKTCIVVVVAAFLFLPKKETVAQPAAGRTIANYIMEVPDSSTHKKAHKGAALCFFETQEGRARALVGAPGLNNNGNKGAGEIGRAHV